jgi:pyruvate/2-oxoglutarate/acetoin dehydrogenase E1 component
VIDDDANLSCGVAAEVAAIVAEGGFEFLKAPIARVTRPDVPTPFSKPLLDAITRPAEKVAAAVRRVLGRRGKAQPRQ